RIDLQSGPVEYRFACSIQVGHLLFNATHRTTTTTATTTTTRLPLSLFALLAARGADRCPACDTASLEVGQRDAAQELAGANLEKKFPLVKELRVGLRHGCLREFNVLAQKDVIIRGVPAVKLHARGQSLTAARDRVTYEAVHEASAIHKPLF